MSGACRLCGTVGVLRESHIVPAFAYRWLKETSGTGYLRGGATPNLRQQDGLKEYWLCAACELLFSGWETKFANEIFYPVVNSSARNIRYGDWLLKFCASMSWRVLSFIQEFGKTDQLSSEMVTRSLVARTTWASFLLGRLPHPGEFEQHVLLLDEIASHEGGTLPPTMNRYLLRTIDIDVAGSSEQAVVYVKLPQVIVVGIIYVPSAKKWTGTKIHVNKGIVGPDRTAVSAELFRFVIERANNVAKLRSAISEKQRKKIDSALERRALDFPSTGTFKAVAADIRLFGESALGESDERLP